ncbi:hypothetical protein D9611_014588 [Ephemerocybe angulata]|uniref:Fatty acid desaturase domain-containing protein n=1 Tax=Ephemerocybe angulata TaxID=980116 RepID=A0A8H5C3F6_9AGAR|nr:hypothetical protein D9611_014588 [Tulosesus angulatus]
MVQKVTSVTTVEQGVYPVPDIPIKAFGAIPSHCFERSLLRSSTYIFWDFFVIGCIYKGASALDPLIDPRYIYLLILLSILRSASLCGLVHLRHRSIWNGDLVNNIVGFILHTSVGVPYHSWRISHAKHHASTSHMTQEQAYVPHTRSELNLPPLKQGQEDLLGSRVSDVVRRELYDALGDSPLGAITTTIFYLLAGWPAYLLFNTSGQKRYPMGTSHFNPTAWASSIATAIYHNGLATVAVIYLIPYLWIHHWLVLITFLQHTDPILPHYRAAAFNFSRGALSTLDRSLMGDCGSIMAWLGAHATHGLAETHVLHHVCSKIPHYHAWEASVALKEKIAGYGLPHEGRPIGWCEFYRVLKECKFVEDEGDVVFFKNEEGVAVMRPAFHDGST